MEEKKDYTFKEIAEIARTLVTPEVAYLAKELQFNVPTNIIYETLTDGTVCTSDVNYYNWNSPIYGKSTCAAPTQDVLLKWLREIKRYYVSVVADCDSVGVFYTVQIIFFDNDNNYHTTYVWEKTELERVKHRMIFKDFEEAQEAGIKKALEIILEKGE